jgi:hypothetical protein
VAEFTYKSARSGGLVIGIGIAIVVETVAFHALLMRSHPLGAWILTLSSLSFLVWLVRDYQAMGTGTIRVTETEIDVRIGRRLSTVIPRANVITAIKPTFRDIPQVASGTRDYLNLTKHIDPNVLLTVREPAVVSLAGLKLRARQISMHLDDPEAFLAAVRGTEAAARTVGSS